MTFECNESHIVGSVKPLIKNADIESPGSDLVSRFESVADGCWAEAVSDHVPGRNAVAAIIPIDGRLEDPVPLWPVVTTLLRNAFVEGLSAGLENMPAKGQK